MRIGIVGHGTVGKALFRYFSSVATNHVAVYDKYLEAFGSEAHRSAINLCDIVFISVPTPSGADGMTCDTSAVEEVVRWVTAPMCIKSTIVPGTTDLLSAQIGREIAFSPEYVGETAIHPWKDIHACGFVIVGGSKGLFDLVVKAYRGALGSKLKYIRTNARTAELCKYMENCFLATKVTFVNQFFEIAKEMGIDFVELRQLWLADPRIGRSHTVVTKNRGFGGRCLPKDLRAMIAALAGRGSAPFLEAVLSYNDFICGSARLEKPMSGIVIDKLAFTSLSKLAR
jgi:UDPglucose 6-dehydrogenase